MSSHPRPLLEEMRALGLPCPECEQPLRVEPCCSRRDCTTFPLACSCGGRGRMSIRLNYIEWRKAGETAINRWALDEDAPA